MTEGENQMAKNIDLGFRMRSVIDFERALLGILWLSWLVYWISAAQRTAPNKRMENVAGRCFIRIPLAIGVFLTVFWRMPLFLPIPALWMQEKIQLSEKPSD